MVSDGADGGEAEAVPLPLTVKAIDYSRGIFFISKYSGKRRREGRRLAAVFPKPISG